MDEKALKTSLWQRIAILSAAVILVGGTILTYVMVVLNSNNSSSSSANEALVNQLSSEYDAKNQEIAERAETLSGKYFKDFMGYKDQAKAYNSANANAAGLETKDLKAGTGKELGEGDTDYMAYYIGWCADGSIFSSSFDDGDEPTSLGTPMIGNSSMIEGWLQGIVGMKLGGVRQITMSGDLAYGDTQEICGGYGSPLKFIVWVLEPDTELVQLDQELTDISYQLYYALYGGTI